MYQLIKKNLKKRRIAKEKEVILLKNHKKPVLRVLTKKLLGMIKIVQFLLKGLRNLQKTIINVKEILLRNLDSSKEVVLRQKQIKNNKRKTGTPTQILKKVSIIETIQAHIILEKGRSQIMMAEIETIIETMSSINHLTIKEETIEVIKIIKITPSKKRINQGDLTIIEEETNHMRKNSGNQEILIKNGKIKKIIKDKTIIQETRNRTIIGIKKHRFRPKNTIITIKKITNLTRDLIQVKDQIMIIKVTYFLNL